MFFLFQGDSVIRYFEITPEPPFVHYINTFQVIINSWIWFDPNVSRPQTLKEEWGACRKEAATFPPARLAASTGCRKSSKLFFSSKYWLFFWIAGWTTMDSRKLFPSKYRESLSSSRLVQEHSKHNSISQQQSLSVIVLKALCDHTHTSASWSPESDLQQLTSLSFSGRSLSRHTGRHPRHHSSRMVRIFRARIFNFPVFIL